ncbi:MAG: DNA cytosine methyltransferase [Rhodothermales bacterium]
MTTRFEKTAADFFAGIGLVSLGLTRAGWKVEYAVDYSEDKRGMYESHFGKGHYHVKDVAEITPGEVPPVSLYHASFPCTDTSVAGSRGGINSGESSSFWSFADVLEKSGTRRPPLVLLENVEGLLTSSGGIDLKAILRTLCRLGYAVDVLLIDASHFVPQSRVRLFILGQLDGERQDALQQEIVLQQEGDVRPEKIASFIRSHPDIAWSIRSLPPLPRLSLSLEDIIDPEAEWWTRERSDYLFNQMFERHKEVVCQMMMQQRWSYGTVFRRTRQREGRRQSTAELRSDGIAGCLRTPKGGSARQIILRAGYGRFDARLLNARECARLMGADDYSILPDLPLNQALFGFGDAVCVPVIEWIAENYLSPIIEERAGQQLAA